METEITNGAEPANKFRRNSRSRSATPIFQITNKEGALQTEKVDSSSAKRTTSGRKSVTISTSKTTIVKSKNLSGKSIAELSVINESTQQEHLAVLKNVAKENESSAVDAAIANNMELRSEKLKAGRYSSKTIGNGMEKGGSAKTTRKSLTRSAATKTSDYSSDDDLDEESKQESRRKVLNVYHGEYWNNFPKTDYTYSPVSSNHYKEVAPGVSVKPNMSRSSYQHSPTEGTAYHSEDIFSPYISGKKTLTYSSEETKSSRRSRFFKPTESGVRVPSYIPQYDSDVDEVDTKVRAAAAASRTQRSSLTVFTSFFTTIWTVITTTWTTTVETTRRMLGLQNDAAGYGYATPVRRQQSHGWWQKVLNSVYFLPTVIRTWDMTITSTSEETTEITKRRRLKYFAWLLLFLLCLLSGGWLLWRDPEEIPVIQELTEMFFLRDWFRHLQVFGAQLGGWLFLPFITKQTQNVDSSSVFVETSQAYVAPPLTVTTPLGSTPPTFEKVEMSVLVDQLLESDQFERFMATRQDKFSREDLIAEILASDQLSNWMALKLSEKEINLEALTLQIISNGQFERVIETSRKPVDLKALAAEIWGTGELQQVINVFLEEKKQVFLMAHLEEQELTKERGSMNADLLRISLHQEFEEKSKHFEAHNSKLSGEIEQLKADIGRKLNASINEMNGRLKSERVRLNEEIQTLKEQLKRCCDKAPPAFPQDEIEKHVLRYIAGVYGMSYSEKVNYDDIQALMANMFVGKKQFEAALANITTHNKAEIRDVTEQSSQTIMDTISERIAEQFASQQKLNMAAGITSHSQEAGGKSTVINSSVGLTDNQVWAIVKQAITTYDADKTGMVDYALESAGGSVVSTRCTESYYKRSASFTLFGIPYWYAVNTPRTVIQPGVHPGECWAFRGSYGFLVIQLASRVRISSFSLEHIPRSLAFAGNIDSAPKDFSVWGMETENDLEPTELGKYTYMQNGTSLQHFIVKRSDIEPFKLIELRIESNHGNLEYTCLYRFRVHGTWVSY